MISLEVCEKCKHFSRIYLRENSNPDYNRFNCFFDMSKHKSPLTIHINAPYSYLSFCPYLEEHVVSDWNEEKFVQYKKKKHNKEIRSIIFNWLQMMYFFFLIVIIYDEMTYFKFYGFAAGVFAVTLLFAKGVFDVRKFINQPSEPCRKKIVL